MSALASAVDTDDAAEAACDADATARCPDMSTSADTTQALGAAAVAANAAYNPGTSTPPPRTVALNAVRKEAMLAAESSTNATSGAAASRSNVTMPWGAAAIACASGSTAWFPTNSVTTTSVLQSNAACKGTRHAACRILAG